MPRRKAITAEELMRSLRADPEWAARDAASEAERSAAERELVAEQADLLSDLKDVGVSASSVYDFVNAGGASPAAVPVLVKHLRRPYHPRIREGIIRSLTVRHAKELAYAPLVAMFESEREPTMRWVIANALSVISSLDELRGLEGIAEYADLFPRR
jgi:hypothetical protein